MKDRDRVRELRTWMYNGIPMRTWQSAACPFPTTKITNVGLASMSQLCANATAKSYLIHVSANYGSMTRKLGRMIVGAYLLPVITYACPVWGYLATMHKKKLQSVLDLSLIHI